MVLQSPSAVLCPSVLSVMPSSGSAMFFWSFWCSRGLLLHHVMVYEQSASMQKLSSILSSALFIMMSFFSALTTCWSHHIITTFFAESSWGPGWCQLLWMVGQVRHGSHPAPFRFHGRGCSWLFQLVFEFSEHFLPMGNARPGGPQNRTEPRLRYQRLTEPEQR